MARKTLLKVMLVAMVGVLLAIVQAQAETVCVLASADESTSPGTISGGTYLDTQSSNNVRESISETLVSGCSRAYHRWTFPDVPAGEISLYREGYRLPAADSENFRFRGWYDGEEGPYFFFGSICAITSSTEGAQECSLNHETDGTYDFHFYVEDSTQNSTGQNETHLSTVVIDQIMVCSTSADP